MQTSFLIVTKYRPVELQFTLKQLWNIFDAANHEVLIFIDGCKETEKLQTQFDWVKWYVSEKSISASPARHFLYQQAKGEVFIGLDDDAHLVTPNSIEIIQNKFNDNPKLGIIAFKEVKGIFESDSEIDLEQEKEEFLTTEFIGCGFAIKRKVYLETRGFPLWIDIYGEEPCVALEVLDLGYDILYTNSIVVNHRVDRMKRQLQGKNYYRFERQLRNSFKIFLVYYPNPVFKILKLLAHNFRKYALSDWTYFRLYCKAVAHMVCSFFAVLKYRKPLQKQTLFKLISLQSIQF